MKTEEKIKKIRENIIHMADLMSEIDLLVEKSNIFANDLVVSYFAEADFDTEKGRLTAQYGLSYCRSKS